LQSKRSGLVIRQRWRLAGLAKSSPNLFQKIQVQTFLRRGLSTFWHQSGTAIMGVDPTTSVVSGRLKVHGLEGLTVADASVFPRVTAGNTMAPSIGVGEMAAKFLTTK